MTTGILKKTSQLQSAMTPTSQEEREWPQKGDAGKVKRKTGHKKNVQTKKEELHHSVHSKTDSCVCVCVFVCFFLWVFLLGWTVEI